MDDLMKQRAVGGAVLVALLVIFVPMFVDFGAEEPADTVAAIPPKPQGEMQTAEIPLADIGNKTAMEFVPPGDGMTPEQLLAEAQDANNDAANRDTPPDMEALPLEAAAPAAAAAAAGTAAKPAPAPVAKADASAKKLPAPKPQLAGPATGSSKAWAVQVGSFTKRENAERLRDKLRKSGYKAFTTKQSSGGKTIVRVRIGPELQRAQADVIRKKIEKDLHMQAKVVEHP